VGVGVELPVADAAVPEGAAELEELPWSPSWLADSLALTRAAPTSGDAEMPVPFVHDDGCSGVVDVNVTSAH